MRLSIARELEDERLFRQKPKKEIVNGGCGRVLPLEEELLDGRQLALLGLRIHVGEGTPPSMEFQLSLESVCATLGHSSNIYV